MIRFYNLGYLEGFMSVKILVITDTFRTLVESKH